LRVSRCPVKSRRNRAGAGNGVNEGASHEFSRGAGSIDGGKEVDVDEMVDEVRGKTKGAAS
jgi:hypothetical protein